MYAGTTGAIEIMGSEQYTDTLTPHSYTLLAVSPAGCRRCPEGGERGQNVCDLIGTSVPSVTAKRGIGRLGSDVDGHRGDTLPWAWVLIGVATAPLLCFSTCQSSSNAHLS